MRAVVHVGNQTLKHFFDTVYYPSLDHVAGGPYGLWVHGSSDTVGAVSAVQKLTTSPTKAAAAPEALSMRRFARRRTNWPGRWQPC
jgi:hypothetical protein